MDIENGDLLHKLFLTFCVDSSELDAVLRAQKIKTKTNGKWLRDTGGQKLN